MGRARRRPFVSAEKPAISTPARTSGGRGVQSVRVGGTPATLHRRRQSSRPTYHVAGSMIRPGRETGKTLRMCQFLREYLLPHVPATAQALLEIRSLSRPATYQMNRLAPTRA